MEGFFSRKDTESLSRSKGKSLSCVTCGLLQKCNNKMTITGKGKKGILNILPLPSAIEDENNSPYTGKSASLLRKTYKSLGIDLEQDCFNIYAVGCYTDEDVTGIQVDCCRRSVFRAITDHKPKIIVLFGNLPLQSVIGHRWKDDLDTIDKWRGYRIPDQELGCYVCPVQDPIHVLSEQSTLHSLKFKKDLTNIAEILQKPFKTAKEPQIIYLDKDLSVLDNITTGKIAFDYETTGLKPYKQGHKIICASVAVSGSKVYVFEIPEDKKLRKPFTDLLKRKSVMKIAQNMKFEDTWSFISLKTRVANWVLDTMLCQHIIDNREKVTGLKFQTYVRLGIVDYASEVAPYLKSDGTSSHSFNKLVEYIKTPDNLKKVLKYCALDSIYEYQLGEMYWETFYSHQGEGEFAPVNSDYIRAYKLFHEGTLALAKAERQGLRIDGEYAERMKIKLTKRIDRLEKEFKETSFYRHWSHSTKSVNINSGLQLSNFLFKTKKITPLLYTEKGTPATSEDALKMLNIPELDLLLERKKLFKVRDTYIEAFVKEAVDDYIHPSYNLNLVKTFRSSSSDPNFQNIPKRDKEAMKMVRSAIFARPGHQLLEMDFSGIEVAIAATYHKDPTMLKYITDPTSDMHGDMAAQIFKVQKFDKGLAHHGLLRQATKNSFIFPQFYGDYYKNCAANMCSNWLKLPQSKWTKDMGVDFGGITIGAHMVGIGIPSYDAFTEHMRIIEGDFWGKRFKVYAQWKEEHWKRYQENGYVSLYTGFTCGDYIMSRNDAINYPVQGAAFHCLLWTFTRLSAALIERGWSSRIVGQIHDAVILDVHPDELQGVYALVQEIGTELLPKAFKWINVPLKIEAEVCEVDGNWSNRVPYPYKK